MHPLIFITSVRYRERGHCYLAVSAYRYRCRPPRASCRNFEKIR
ncbi:hypothetical protein [Methanimicrococcus stummii]|nr:hypothetical protein [Methanimicrococcus sp. Es2]